MNHIWPRDAIIAFVGLLLTVVSLPGCTETPPAPEPVATGQFSGVLSGNPDSVLIGRAWFGQYQVSAGSVCAEIRAFPPPHGNKALYVVLLGNPPAVGTYALNVSSPSHVLVIQANPTNIQRWRSTSGTARVHLATSQVLEVSFETRVEGDGVQPMSLSGTFSAGPGSCS